MVNKEEILEKAKQWFRDTVAINHIKNTRKLKNPKELNINPFLSVYLANFLTGNSDPKSIAKAILYPRVLGTSITTSFGANMQDFASNVLDGFGSTTPGIDIEFIDQVDGNRKYCQLKVGPDTINKDDVESIAGHFRSTINLGRANNLRLSLDDLIVGVMYGVPGDLNGNYKRITKQYHYPVIIGESFWHRLTGDQHFYLDLIQAIASVAIEADFSAELDEVVNVLAATDAITRI